MAQRTTLERWEAFVIRPEEPDDCWGWSGYVDGDGYARLWVGGRNPRAHRVGYELLVGPIPTGLDLDHVCHSRDLACAGGVCAHRRCVNPAHLEPVTRLVNAQRGRKATRTHCPQGHDYAVHGKIRLGKVRLDGTPTPQRRCMACHADKQRAQYWANKGRSA